VGEESNGRWKEIDEFLWNLNWPAHNTQKEKQQLRRETIKHHVSDDVLYQKRKSNIPATMVVLSTAKRCKAMEIAHNLSVRCEREIIL
jgi:hypothetical protein